MNSGMKDNKDRPSIKAYESKDSKFTSQNSGFLQRCVIQLEHTTFYLNLQVHRYIVKIMTPKVILALVCALVHQKLGVDCFSKYTTNHKKKEVKNDCHVNT
jgi:hypothetical protein